MMADAILGSVALKNLLGNVVTSAANREAAAQLHSACDMSWRRACRVLNLDRTSVRCQAIRAPDTELCERLSTLAQERRRFDH